MSNFDDTQIKIHAMIDELKGLCSSYGLSNQASEEVVVTSVFLYKFLNDKFIFNLSSWSEEVGIGVDEIKIDESLMDAFTQAHQMDVNFGYEDTIEYLSQSASSNKFYDLFDKALADISKRNERFSIHTAEGGYKPLFESLSVYVEDKKKNAFAKGIFSIITSGDKFDFTSAFESSFDFFSSIFEYLIKDYNVAAGKYAEYYTPQSVSSIIAKCLVGMSEVIEASEIYDPSAGSGSLVLHLANALRKEDGSNRAIIYTQDISGKSTRFLRLNLVLNGMAESLDNLIQGDTLLEPAHFNIENQPSSGLKQFNYIVSNPPFKTNFSNTRDSIESLWSDTERFFAGVPSIPANKKDSMAIFLLFIQHVLYSLKDDGKAAVVVPTGFLTASEKSNKIAYKIRKEIIDNRWLKGVISMPSNVFANTGTNVSVLFIDKANRLDTAILVDASGLGEKIKDGKNQRTVLHDSEINLIIDTFLAHKDVDDLAVDVDFDKISKKNYSFSAGQYYSVKIHHIDISEEEFNTRIESYKDGLDKLFSESHKLESEILNQIGGMKT